MPVRDYYHEVVCDALQKDGWIITHDPYLAVPDSVRESVFEEEAGQVLIEAEIIRLFTFDIDKKEVVKWMI